MNQPQPIPHPGEGSLPKSPGIDPSDLDLEKEIAEQFADQGYDQLMDELSRSVEQEPAPDQSGDDPNVQMERRMARGRIADVRGDDVFVTLTGFAGKDQGVVPLRQFDRAPKIGSIMDFMIDRHDEPAGLVHLSREGAVSRANWDSLRNGAVVEARVTAANKGGLEMELAGGIRAFMPASQVDTHFVDDLDACIGTKYIATVRELDQRSKKIVLSRRLYLETQRRAQQEKTWSELEVDQIRTGTVSSVTDYGAFVDIGGLDGLVHVSDMSYQRVAKPSDVVKPGQQVEVVVLKIDRENQRVGLGIKQVAPDPWSAVTTQYRDGDQVSGRVVRIADFGAFIELEPGVDGLLPVGEISWKRIHHPKDVLKEDDSIWVRVLSVDIEKRRISLSLKQAQGDPWVGAEGKYPKGGLVEGTVLSITEFGAFIELEAGVEALVHISELTDHKVGQVSDVLQIAERKPFRILTVDEQQRRISLSLKAVNRPAPTPEAGDSSAPGSSLSQTSSGKAKKPFKPLKGGIE